MEFLNEEDQGAVLTVGQSKEEHENRRSQSPFWRAAFCPGTPAACAHWARRCPARVTSLHSHDSTPYFSRLMDTSPPGQSSWSFFKTQILSHQPCQWASQDVLLIETKGERGVREMPASIRGAPRGSGVLDYFLEKGEHCDVGYIFTLLPAPPAPPHLHGNERFWPSSSSPQTSLRVSQTEGKHCAGKTGAQGPRKRETTWSTPRSCLGTEDPFPEGIPTVTVMQGKGESCLLCLGILCSGLYAWAHREMSFDLSLPRGHSWRVCLCLGVWDGPRISHLSRGGTCLLSTCLSPAGV